MTTRTRPRLPYMEAREELFTSDNGRRLLAHSGLVAKKLGRFDTNEFMVAVPFSGDTWKPLNCLDYLVDIGLCRELTAGCDVAGQHRLYQYVWSL